MKTQNRLIRVPDILEPLGAIWSGFNAAHDQAAAGDFDGAAQTIADAHDLAQYVEGRCVSTIDALNHAKSVAVGGGTSYQIGRLSNELADKLGITTQQAFDAITGGAHDQ